MIKRVMDIAGSIVGLVITAVVTVFLAPPLLIEFSGTSVFRTEACRQEWKIF